MSDYAKKCFDEVKEKSFEGLLPLANGGNPYAQFLLADLYEQGKDVQKDDERAAFWREQAKADLLRIEYVYDDDYERRIPVKHADNILFQYLLGALFEKEGNWIEAAEWYCMASLQECEFRKEFYDSWGRSRGEIQETENAYLEPYQRRAQFRLSQFYRSGTGVICDVKKAFEWCEKAVQGETPDPAALEMLGDMYALGAGTKPDFARAVELYEQAGLVEKAAPYYRLAALAYQDRANAIVIVIKTNKQLSRRIDVFDVYVDEAKAKEKRNLNEKALAYFGKAADRGDVEALEKLASVCTELATEYYRLARKHLPAAKDTYHDYDRDKGKSLSQAAPYYEQAASYYENIGETEKAARVRIELADEYVRLAKDSYGEKAASYYEKAYALGKTDAADALSDLYVKLGDKAKAEKFFVERAEQGDDEAKWQLGKRYAKGDGVEQSAEKAEGWLARAAENSAERQWKFGEWYADGDVLLQDGAKAALWLEKAAAQGDSEMRFRLGERYMLGKGLPQDSAKAKEWLLQSAESGNTDALRAIAGILEQERDFKAAARYYMDAGETEKANRCLIAALDGVGK